MFSTEAKPVRWFEQVRWKDGCFCPHGGSMNTYRVRSRKPQPYRCPDCKRYFSVTIGTVMHGTHLPLRTWAYAVYLMSTSLKGVSSMKLHRDLGIPQNTAWFMAHRIREGWKSANFGKLKGIVEADETYVAGLDRNKRFDKKLRAGRGTVGKVVVVGVKSRQTKQVRAGVIDSPSRPELHRFRTASCDSVHGRAQGLQRSAPFAQ